MADTSVQHEVEDWVVKEGLKRVYPGHTFSGAKLQLSWGGRFNFDAVSEDGHIVCSISTSASRTASGKLATAKFQKLKTDALYLLNLKNEARLSMVFTEISMLHHLQKEVKIGRFPPDIELWHVELPHDLHAKVLAVRDVASKETSPTRDVS